MAANGFFVPNVGAINLLLKSPGGMVSTHVSKFGRRADELAKKYAPKDHGELASSINSKTAYHAAGIFIILAADSDHAMVIHQGHKVIRPVKSKYLKFQPKDLRGTGKYVRTGKVRAVGGYPFLTAALAQANRELPADVQFRIVINQKPRRDPGPKGLPVLPPTT